MRQGNESAGVTSLSYRGMVLSKEDLEKLIVTGVPNSKGFKGTYFFDDAETAAMYSFGTYGVEDRTSSYAHVLIELKKGSETNTGERIFPNQENGVAVSLSEIRNIYLFEPGFLGGALYLVPLPLSP